MRMGKYSTFEKRYHPLMREDGSVLYETYGADLRQVLDTPVIRVWTIVDCDGKLVITAGYHIVNRMNYIITKYPWMNNELCYSY